MKIKIIFGILLFVGNAVAEQVKGDADVASTWTTTPSRYLGESGSDYVAAMRARLAMAGRSIGPFGLTQDPNKVEDIPLVKAPRKKAQKIVTPFSDVINSIKISTINFQEKSFLVGIDTYREGQEFAVEVNSERLTVRIEVVGSHAITFTNLKSGETIDRHLDLVPGVILQGKGDIIVPGMTPAGGGAQPVMKINLNEPVHSR